MTFNEEWFGPESCAALAALASLTNTLDGDVVEIGSWEGRSTVALAAAVRPVVVHAVDTWAGSPGEISADLAKERDVFATFTENTQGLNVQAHRMGWRDYLPTSGPIRFCFIDAEHSYIEVRDNIEAVLPLMVRGGIVCGDDNHHPPVQQAVTDVLRSARLTASLWWVRT